MIKFSAIYVYYTLIYFTVGIGVVGIGVVSVLYLIVFI